MSIGDVYRHIYRLRSRTPVRMVNASASLKMWCLQRDRRDRFICAYKSKHHTMEPQLDLFWLIATLCVVFGANGVYRRLRYARLRRRRNGDSRPVVVLDYLSGHLTRL